MVTPTPEASPGSVPPVQYAYMFEKNKSPTKQLDALLRAIARFICAEIGNKLDPQLTPLKLAAFYKAVGGNYDSVFVEVPYSTVSYIWQVTGCQHALLPTENDFEAPCVPALTPRGFSRWESLEILLGPEEHVPFLQYAVKNWSLKHPETGQDFPAELPEAVFPAHADAEVDYWHKSCADRLRDAASKDNTAASTPNADPHPEQPAEPPRFNYVPPREGFNGPPRQRPETDYFNRPMYTHVPGRHPSTREAREPRDRERERDPRDPRDPRDRVPNRSPEAKLRRDAATDQSTRRRSFSDYASPPPSSSDGPPHHSHSATYLDPGQSQQPAPRRHSHPRHISSDSSEDEIVIPEPSKLKRRHPDLGSRRGAPPTVPVPPPAMASTSTSFRPHRSEMRSEEAKRRSGPSPRGSLRSRLTQTVSSILPNGLSPERPRHSRQSSNNEPIRSRRSREQFPPSRLSRSYSDHDSSDSESRGAGSEERQRRRMRDDRERAERSERHRDGPRPRDADREREDDRDSGSRRQYPRRPDNTRRTSSHADIDRRREQGGWDPRERERDRDRARDERRKHERRSSPEEDDLIVPPPTTGVTGRRYPEPAYS